MLHRMLRVGACTGFGVGLLALACSNPVAGGVEPSQTPDESPAAVSVSAATESAPAHDGPYYTPDTLPEPDALATVKAFGVAGYVHFVHPCQQAGAQSGECGRNENHYLVLSSALDAQSGKRIVVHFGNSAPSPWPSLGRYYEFDVVPGGPGYGHNAVLDRGHRQSTPPPAAATPTYADGSWSVADALGKLHPPSDGGRMSVTAYLIGGLFCPNCPPTLACAPCATDLQLADSYPARGPALHLFGASMDLAVAENGATGKRFRISGALTPTPGASASSPNLALNYESHTGAAPVPSNAP